MSMVSLQHRSSPNSSEALRHLGRDLSHCWQPARQPTFIGVSVTGDNGRLRALGLPAQDDLSTLKLVIKPFVIRMTGAGTQQPDNPSLIRTCILPIFRRVAGADFHSGCAARTSRNCIRPTARSRLSTTQRKPDSAARTSSAPATTPS